MKESVELPIKIGDTILTGKFKNKKTIIKSLETDDYGMPTYNGGKKLTTFRMLKEDEVEEYKWNEGSKSFMKESRIEEQTIESHELTGTISSDRFFGVTFKNVKNVKFENCHFSKCVFLDMENVTISSSTLDNEIINGCDNFKFEDCQISYLGSPNNSDPIKELTLKNCKFISLEFQSNHLGLSLISCKGEEVTISESKVQFLDVSYSTIVGIAFDECEINNPTILDTVFRGKKGGIMASNSNINMAEFLDLDKSSFLLVNCKIYGCRFNEVYAEDSNFNKVEFDSCKFNLSDFVNTTVNNVTCKNNRVIKSDFEVNNKGKVIHNQDQLGNKLIKL
jgi:uncharacterized protein YjbI with pentapeptide repeats